jgi:hypothetical protein
MRSIFEPFVIHLEPAEQSRYRDTAWNDARTILRHWFIVAAVAVVTLAASIVATVESHLSVVMKVVLAALGAGVGTVMILGPVVFVAMLLVAPHRQRNQARDELARLAIVSDSLDQEFSEWLLELRAGLPDHGLRMIPSLFASAEVRAASEQREDALAQLQVMVGAQGRSCSLVHPCPCGCEHLLARVQDRLVGLRQAPPRQ